MKTDSRLGTFEDVLHTTTPALAGIARYMRLLIEELHPDAVEVPRPGEPTVAYGIGPKKMSEAYAYLGPQRASLNLGFYHGAALPDPAGLLEGTGKALRHVKLTTLEQAARPEVRALLVAAREERQQALGVRSSDGAASRSATR